ncbi:MAG: FAD:protein FMN transferase, partial [Lachnospiraceae bacterium]|nr:FAD:protein FMN transferase [Lachnospiraceae bacterium]
MNKRSLFTISASVLALISIGFIYIRFFGYPGHGSKESVSFFAMDTYMTVSATGANAQDALERVRIRIEDLEKLLDPEAPESPVYALDHGEVINPTDDLTVLVNCSLEYSTLTNGAFNVLVYPLVKEWGFISKEYNIPKEDRIEELCALVASSGFITDESPVTLRLSKGAEADFGAIAKGYATEKSVEILKEAGIKSALINLGGNIYALGSKENGSPWKVAVKRPGSGSSYLGTLKVTDTAVITSGSYERFFERNGKRYHHIIDPYTGYPAESGLASVTIVASDPTLADALS